MGRWRAAALILAVVAFGLAGFGWPTWLSAHLPFNGGRTAFFWLGVACFLLAAWGRPGT
jgi:hypothetical protein